MKGFRNKSWRLLYVLALVQLIGGPLVLLQVTVFCKLALHQAPRVGVVQAAASAWVSEDFQAVLATANLPQTPHDKSQPPAGNSKAELEKVKMPLAPWESVPTVLVNISQNCEIIDHGRIWTPAWPQAPPGPPPRVG